MPKTLAALIPVLRPSTRQIAVAAIANKSYDTGWRDALGEAAAIVERSRSAADPQAGADEAVRALTALLGQDTGSTVAA